MEITRKTDEGILIITAIHSGKQDMGLLRILSKALELKRKLQTKAELVVFGAPADLKESEEWLKKTGMNTLYLMKQKELATVNEEIYTQACYQMIKACKPEIVLMPSTIHFKSIAARVAARLDTGLTADCIDFDLDMENRLLLQIRPAYDGSKLAVITCAKNRPQMATVNPWYLKEKGIYSGNISKIVVPELALLWEGKSKVILSEKTDIVKPEDTGIIIGIGRGIKTKADVARVQAFAEKTGGRLAATRAVVDSGLLNVSYQVGLSGKSINCRVYYAFGISGAVQHIMGLNSVKTIVAVNTDKEAPIFRIAHYGIVGDWREVLNILAAESENISG